MILNNNSKIKIILGVFFVFYSVLFSLSALAEVFHIPNNQKCTGHQDDWVEASSKCIKISKYNSKQNPPVMAIFLHGDYWVSGVGYMNKIAEHHATGDIMTVALIRPGYFDEQGNFSDGKMNGAFDHYSLENVNVLSEAISNLKKKFGPQNIVLIGHSGGAAMSALIANHSPLLINGIFLFACPCDVKRWQPSWKRSLSPIENIEGIKHDAKIRAYVGALDDNTYPELSRDYIKLCRNKGLDAEFFLLTEMGHNFRGIDNDKELHAEINKFIQLFMSSH